MGHTRRLAQGSSPNDDHFHDDNDKGENDDYDNDGALLTIRMIAQ